MRTFKTEFARSGFSQPRRREMTLKSRETQDKPKEQLTDREIRDLMGTNRQTYHRKNGAVRRR